MQKLILIPGLLNDENLWKYQRHFLENQADITVAKIEKFTDIRTQAAHILQNAPQKFALCGLSMGGYIGMEILKQAPHRISKVAFLDTSWEIDTDEKRRQRENMINLSAHGRFEGVTSLILKQILAKKSLENHDIIAEIKSMAQNVGQKEFVNQQKLILSRTESVSLLPQIQVPALCIVGKEDVITPPSVMQKMAKALPYGYFCEIEDAAHLPPLEQPYAVNAAMQIWLQM